MVAYHKYFSNLAGSLTEELAVKRLFSEGLTMKNKIAHISKLASCLMTRLFQSRVMKRTFSAMNRLYQNPVIKWIIWLPWQIIVLVTWFASFGGLNLSTKRQSNNGAMRCLWRLFYPFLLSMETSPITVPSTITIPCWKFDGWRQPGEAKWHARGFALLFTSILYLNYEVPAASQWFQSYLGSWFTLVEMLVIPLLLTVSLYKSVPLPGWRESPIQLEIPWWEFDGWRQPGETVWLAPTFASLFAAILYLNFKVPAVSQWFQTSLNSWLPLAASPWLNNHLSSLFIMIEILVFVLLAISLCKSLPLPTWRKSPLQDCLPFGRRYLFSVPEAVKSWILIALIGSGIFLVNHYAVQRNVMYGDLMTTITEKNSAQLPGVVKSYAIILTIFVVLYPVYEYVKELLILEWTKFTTRFLLRLYMKDRNYYPVSLLRTPDNPNERIQQDVPAMCKAALTFAFTCVDSLVTFFLFGGLLWDIEKGLVYEIPFSGQTIIVQHLLLIALVSYAILGSNGVVRVGKRLIGLWAEQKKLGANFRVGMVLFEKYAEPIAAYHGEEREYKSLWYRFMLSLKNNYVIVRWQRNLSFFTDGYQRIAYLVPYMAMAPFYFVGKIKFGMISQASNSFQEILWSASIFVSQFDDLTGLLASINRVGELRDTLEGFAQAEADGLPRIRHEEGELLTIDNMTLCTPDRSKVLVRNLNLDMKPGRSVLIKGPSGSGKTSILRAVVGLPLWDRGEGVIAMPSAIGRTLMLTQLAYLPSDASLRDQMLYPAATDVSDDTLLAVLKDVNLEYLPKQVGGFDATPNWDQLSGGERQRLVVARALINKVRLVIADEATSGLDIANEVRLYQQMKAADITMLSVGHRESLVRFHDDVIELDGEGGWRTMPADQSTW